MRRPSTSCCRRGSRKPASLSSSSLLPPHLRRYPDLDAHPPGTVDGDDVALVEDDIERHDRPIAARAFEPQIATMKPPDWLLGAIAMRMMLARGWDRGGDAIAVAVPRLAVLS